MKKIILLLLLSSCSVLAPSRRDEFITCMAKFADLGYKADSIIQICEAVFGTHQ